MTMVFANEWNYIIAAYVVTWLGLGGYSIYLARLTRRAEQDYEAARSSGKGKS
jgi:CcmD family protein